MKIIVYGLGIIGASLAAALKRAGHHVLGRNRNAEPIRFALEHDMIDGEATSFTGADVVILALPPAATVRVLDGEVFPDRCIVTDVCGVKRKMEQAVYEKPRNYRYIGAHPMAGKETSGILSASVDLFQGKNLILTRCENTEKQALETVTRLGTDAGFSRIVVCSAAEHDQKIALTSQLAHIVSNAYIKSASASGVSGFTGGSFQDMTRVGGVDETLWTELYFANRDYLLTETEGLIDRLKAYCAVLECGTETEMRELLKEGRIAFLQSFCEK